MSWSVSGIGKPAALSSKLCEAFCALPTMSEPEQTGARAALMAIEAIVPAFPDSHVVRVECNGSQYTPDSSKEPDKKVNTLMIKIETLGPIAE